MSAYALRCCSHVGQSPIWMAPQPSTFELSTVAARLALSVITITFLLSWATFLRNGQTMTTCRGQTR